MAIVWVTDHAPRRKAYLPLRRSPHYETTFLSFLTEWWSPYSPNVVTFVLENTDGLLCGPRELKLSDDRVASLQYIETAVLRVFCSIRCEDIPVWPIAR